MADEETPAKQVLPDNVVQHPAAASNVVTIFKYYDLSKIPSPPKYLTREIPSRTVSVWSGEGGVGKTYLGLDVSVSLVLGLGEFGRDAKRKEQVVIYVDMENGVATTTVRVHALMRAKGFDPKDKKLLDGKLYILDGQASSFNLDDDSHLAGLYRDIVSTGATLVFLDPIMAMMKGDPYSNPDVRALMDHKIRPLTRSGAAIVVPQHVRKRSGNPELDRGSQDTMGARAWIDAADEAFKIRDIGDDKLIVEHTKGRTRGKGWPFVLKMDLPPKDTPVEEMRSRVIDLGRPQKTLSKEDAAEVHVLHILRTRGPLQAGELDQAVSEATGCSLKTAQNARTAAEAKGLILKGLDHKAPYAIIGDGE